MYVFWHNHYTLSMNSTQVGVLQEPHHVVSSGPALPGWCTPESVDHMSLVPVLSHTPCTQKSTGR